MREPASGVVSAVFRVTGWGWVLEVPLSSLEGEVFVGDMVTCPVVPTRRTVTVKSWDIPRKLGEPCVVFVVGEVREEVVESWLHRRVSFVAPDESSVPNNRS